MTQKTSVRGQIRELEIGGVAYILRTTSKPSTVRTIAAVLTGDFGTRYNVTTNETHSIVTRIE
jgi:hypothetical protein